MHWFRSRSSLGSWLALLALTTQLVLSFGHVHLDRNGSIPGHSSAVLLGAGAPTGAGATFVPPSHEAPALAHEYCAICAIIHLAGTLVAAQAPSLALPAVFGRTPSQRTAELGLTAQHHSPFPARAPPVA